MVFACGDIIYLAPSLSVSPIPPSPLSNAETVTLFLISHTQESGSVKWMPTSVSLPPKLSKRKEERGEICIFPQCPAQSAVMNNYSL